MVLRGVAVGMKYLRDVFDALALQTPCFFLMEHIHVLGSKRPFLISDDENIKGIQANVGLEQQEVHETNQMIYQLNRHSMVDFKRPYKGDFSMGIPTNFFVQSFYSNFENNSNSIFLSAGSTRTIKNSIFSTGSINTQNRNPISPLSVDSIEHSLMKQGFAEKEKTDNAFQNSENSQKQYSFQSRLQIAQEQIFAPPATSPFTILMMKEQKKLKPKKIVQESSWGGLSTDQFISYQKESSSVRAKVALLADITMNLSRGKLDMITDLLVIIDSVRSNRGFVVFATTHLPSLLDPALRRPGRFDETIYLSQSPNFLNRF
jgi:SpoVK/Ycf46/Vps4 family AAA+-type ATPase